VGHSRQLERPHPRLILPATKKRHFRHWIGPEILEIGGMLPDIKAINPARTNRAGHGVIFGGFHMADYTTIRTAGAGVRAAQIDEGLRAHMNKVYGLMSVGMVLTGGVAWAVGTNDAMLSVLFGTPLKWVVMFAPLIMVFAFSAMINRLSAAAAQLFFYTFAALMGLSISFIFAVYTGVSIAQTFFATAIAFASLSLYGYTTKRDLSGMGTFLMMGLIGLIVASIVNIFMGSSALQFAISVIGILIFAGLTAYDTQSIKNEYVQHAAAMDQEWLGKSAIMGALRLYLDFINMFMFLLSFMGNRE
jgi:FtsH-binding integral membrane protein